jgi:hypothetical protein
MSTRHSRVAAEVSTSLSSRGTLARQRPNHTLAANPAGASRLQSWRPVRQVAELGSLGHFTHHDIQTVKTHAVDGRFRPCRRGFGCISHDQ